MPIISDVNAALTYLLPRFAGLERELLVVLLLSPTMRIRGEFEIRGDRDSTFMPKHRIVRAVADTHARGVLLAHNHPSGNCRASEADKRITREIAQACRTVDARLLDHIIIARDGFTSFRRMGWL